MTEAEKMRAGAEALDDAARWSEQPDMPSGVFGFVSANDLRMRAAAMRAVADEYDA